MSGKLFIILLLGACFVTIVDSSRRPRNDVPDEPSCEDEDDNDNNYDSQGRPRRVGASRPTIRKVHIDDWDVVEDEDDESYNRYENTNQEGICILERKKCPQGDWKMFKRQNESVCLRVMGTPNKIDPPTAARLCRKEANGRLMTIDNQQEREWIKSTALGGSSYHWLIVAGYRSRNCQMKPHDCKDKETAFTKVNGTSDNKFLYTRWFPIVHNRITYSVLDNCLNYFTLQPLSADMLIQDFTCHDWYNIFLCGVTVM